MSTTPSIPHIDAAVVARYRENYKLGGEIGAEEVRRHWEIESALTKKLLHSDKETRWAVFEECYTKLYCELPWLNKSEEVTLEQLRPWSKILPRDAKVFEIGSGKAQLLKYLASQGYDCVATEITKERGAKHVSDTDGLRWHVTDGVNLTRFESPSTYDIVISTQVIEHLHPDDILDHFSNVRKILKPAGRYIFDTPHVGVGPSDVSKIFGFERAVCMHLKEYGFIELGNLLKAAGFTSVEAVLFRRRPITIGPYVSHWYYQYCYAWDWLVHLMRLSPRRERALRVALRWAFVPTNIWLIASNNT